MPMPTPDEVRTQLASFGRKIDNFNQNDAGRKFNTDERLTDGYCEGVTLDLINGLKASQTTIQLTPTIIAGIKECLGFTLPATQQVDKVEQLYYAIPKKRAKIDSTKPDATEILGSNCLPVS
jgi:hypothetical protein